MKNKVLFLWYDFDICICMLFFRFVGFSSLIESLIIRINNGFWKLAFCIHLLGVNWWIEDFYLDKFEGYDSIRRVDDKDEMKWFCYWDIIIVWNKKLLSWYKFKLT